MQKSGPHFTFLPGEALNKTEPIAVIRFNVIEVALGFDENKAILGTLPLIPRAVLFPIFLLCVLEIGGVTPQAFCT